MKHKGMYPC